MKYSKWLCLLSLAAAPFGVCLAQLPEGFRSVAVNRQVRDFALDSIDLSSPLAYYLSRAWVKSTGKMRYWADISTSMFFFDPDAADEPVEESLRSYICNEHIDAVVSYRDSAAVIVTHQAGEDFLLINFCWIEEGRWVNGGQRLADDAEQAERILADRLPECYANLPRIAAVKRIPEDIGPFVDYLAGIETSPEAFVMEMLSARKLVINGEYHRRKVSWDMLKRLIALPEFPDKVGHVFLELPSWCQSRMDAFLASDTLDTEAVLDIFREEQPNGWWDRGEFEFICGLWRLNRSLPADRRIRVVLADYQVPYSLALDRKAMQPREDRNTHMANVIAETIESATDPRNHLFLVGCGHAYKSRQAGYASAAHGRAGARTAAAQLAERLGDENVFTVFQHVLPGDNSGNNRSPIRGGVFDRAFAAAGNRPVGFALAGSPFGEEPFDGIYEIKFNAATGTYADNFDGYLFLHPVEGEPAAAPLTEIFTEEFVEEIKRRAAVMGTAHVPAFWFGRKAEDLTREYIVERLKQE